MQGRITQYCPRTYSLYTESVFFLFFFGMFCATKGSPLGTWQLYNVSSTSMQRHDVASTLMRCCLNAACPLSPILENTFELSTANIKCGCRKTSPRKYDIADSIVGFFGTIVENSSLLNWRLGDVYSVAQPNNVN